jgi:membrane-bound metal-dependent hydrolase YbcI (DUF457 family)
MMVGHAALAFALAAWAAAILGLSRERALAVAVAAGAFAAVPDVDMGYAVVGLARAFQGGGSFPEVFWETGNVVHRGVTHSLLVGGVTATLFGLVAYRGRLRLAGVVGLCSLVVGAIPVLGWLEATVMVIFVAAGLAVALTSRWMGLSPRATLAAALVGVLSHPFGDMFTGTAPELLYPLDVHLLPQRLLLSSDPTLHLLGTFGLELTAIWLAAAVYLHLNGRHVLGYVHRRAVLGAGYVGAVLALPPPTLSVSYHFVFSVLAVGLVGVVDLPVPDLRSPKSRRGVAVTGLAAVTIAWLTYIVGYLLVA